MIRVQVEPGQTLLDIAIQHAGDASMMFMIAQANNIVITDDLTPGSFINVPEVANERVTNYYSRNSIVPAVGVLEQKEGIGYWIIGEDFIVS